MILGQGLYVTAVGMGLVFLSLAILYFAIKGLDRLFPAREEASAPAVESSSVVAGSSLASSRTIEIATKEPVTAAVNAQAPVSVSASLPTASQPLANEVFEAKLAGKLHQIEVGAVDEESQRVVLDGMEHQVERGQSSPDSLVIDGRAYNATVLEAGDRLIKVRVGDTSYEIELPVPAPRPVETPASPASPVAPGGEPVPAPLPGRILRVLVKPADRVERGQELCVIEAMKMENSIRAPRDGIVGEVLVRAGQTVAAGEKLLYL